MGRGEAAAVQSAQPQNGSLSSGPPGSARPPAELVGADPATAWCVVPLLPWHPLVDGAGRAEGLALPDVPPTVASAGRCDSAAKGKGMRRGRAAIGG